MFKVELKSYIDSGCADYTHRLGCITVPDGYSILLNSDGSHFFFFRHSDLGESCTHWNKFAVLRWIKREINHAVA